MTKHEVEQLLQKPAFPNGEYGREIIETHISWVILTDTYAYKIKRPKHFSFLDFSTLEKRRYYCHRELELNRRLAPEMYLRVWPIRKNNQQLKVVEEEGEIVDYALQMKLMDNERRMDRLLRNEEVSEQAILQIASKLANFHTGADVLNEELDIDGLVSDFTDILRVKDVLQEELGNGAEKKLKEAAKWASDFLHKQKPLFEKRIQEGYIVDGHGDLHSRNIFLLEEPVIFDCIEFNDHFRKVDILDELAFFCMDLEFYEQKVLEKPFLNKYLSKNPVIAGKDDWTVYHYYKWYRANVRLKVNCLDLIDDTEPNPKTQKMIRRYFHLFESYFLKMVRIYT